MSDFTIAAQTAEISVDRAALSNTPKLIFWILIVSSLPAAVLLGGMARWLMTLAVGLAAIVYTRPAEAPGAGMLFLFAADILLPYAARFDVTVQPREMYYWAAGLFLITMAAVARLGLRRIFAVPLAAKVFFAVAVAAAVRGVIQGADASYILRQFYGMLLFVVYFGIALYVGNEALLVRRIRRFGVLCAFFFFIYYLAVFPQYGFHKEMGFNGTQASLLAVLLFITGVESRRFSSVLGSLALLMVPVLIFMRKDVLTFLVALLVALALIVKSTAKKVICFALIAVAVLPALLPSAAQAVLDDLAGIPRIASILPEGTHDASTLYDRTLQLVAATDTIRLHPWLGTGLGSDIEWDSPFLGLEQVAYVDNGWAYLLQKLGLLGAAAFLWYLITVLRGVSREAPALSACLLAATFVTMFSEPVFFHFTTAPYLGTFAGLLLGRRYRPRALDERFTFVSGGSI